MTQDSEQPSARSGSVQPDCSAAHGICKDCRHRWPQDGAPPYHPGSWCYMFRDGAFLESQGYCGQFRPAKPPNDRGEPQPPDQKP